jgi:hypothetical protein
LFASSTAALAYALDPGTGEVSPRAFGATYLDVSAHADVGEDALAYSALEHEDERTPRRRTPFMLAGSALAAVLAVAAGVVVLSLASDRPSDRLGTAARHNPPAGVATPAQMPTPVPAQAPSPPPEAQLPPTSSPPPAPPPVVAAPPPPPPTRANTAPAAPVRHAPTQRAPEYVPPPVRQAAPAPPPAAPPPPPPAAPPPTAPAGPPMTMYLHFPFVTVPIPITPPPPPAPPPGP